MRILFMGLGSIGRRHARLIHERWPEWKLFALRSVSGRRVVLEYTKDCPTLTSLDPPPDAVFVCTPTVFHLKNVFQVLDVYPGASVFMEKPVGSGLLLADSIMRYLRATRRVVYLAYPMRFHPLVHAIQEAIATCGGVLYARLTCSSYLPGWRPGTDHRKSYSANESQGGGVLLDMSHHAYFAEMLFGPVVQMTGIRRRVTDITVDTDDTADLILQHESGITAGIHVDYFTQVGGCDKLELTTGDGRCRYYNLGLNSRETDDMFVAQLGHFFENINNPDLDGNLLSGIPLFRKLIEVREEAGV